MGRSVLWILLLLAAFALPTQTVAQQSTAGKKTAIVGKLTRVMAIGGETTGWSLELRREITLEGKKMRSVEVSGPAEALEKLKDQRVRARGVLVHHTGMERGDYLVLEISAIKAVEN